MALKILLVDPSETWISEAAEFFKRNLYEVDSVTNGKAAQLNIFNNQYFYVVLNLDVQNHSGFQVMKFIKTNYPTLNVILTMNEDRIKDGTFNEKDIARLGASGFLIHPFTLQELGEYLEGKQSIGHLLSSLPKNEGVSQEEEVSGVDDDFTKVRIDEFLSSKNVLFDIYIRLGSGKYIKILHAGDSFTRDRIEKYKNEKKVEYLYFANSDRRKYIRYCNFMAQKIVAATNVSPEIKLSLMKNSTEKLIEEMYSEGLKPQILDQGKEICDNMYNMIQKEKNLYKVLRNYEDFDASAYSHSYLVTMFSSMILKQFDWESKITLDTLAMACMFHDIGKMKLSKDLLGKRPEDMTAAELEDYKAHPVLGADLLAANRLVPPSVSQIVRQHHEASDGSGFPSGIKDSKILTLAKIVNVVDHFAHVVQDKNLLPIMALREMLLEARGGSKFNAIVMEKFIKIFIDPSKIEEQDNMVVKSA